MTTMEYLERRAFNAGYEMGRYHCTSREMFMPYSLEPRDKSWEEYRSQPVQLELPLEEAPNEE